MPLNALQSDFAQELTARNGADTLVLNSIQHDGIAPSDRIAIYRNNVQLSLADTLGETYSSVKALVGDEFFYAMAREYVLQTPSDKADLTHYGESFPEFVASFDHAQGLPYLADVARFDQAWHRSFFAKNDPLISPEEIAALAGNDPEQITLTFRSSTHLLSLRYPADALWRFCVAEEKGAHAETPDVSEGDYPVLLWRPHLKVQHERLSHATYVAYTALFQGESLGAAMRKAYAIDAEFAITEWMEQLLAKGIISSVRIAS